MSKKDKRQPKIASAPHGKEVRAHYQPHSREARTKENPGSTDHLSPAWQFHLCDKEHELWGWGKLKSDEFIRVITQHLQDHEKMTWGQIKQAAGGRSSGTNSHPVPTSGFINDAQKRLRELKLDGYEELFSLRLNNTLRLYGIREGRVLRFVWHDPHHGSKQGAYPVK